MSCRLMKLPAELRLIIYEFSFAPDRPDEEEFEIKNMNMRAPQCALLATCKEVLNEAKPTFDNAVKLFLGINYYYSFAAEYDPSVRWTESLQMGHMHAGPRDLPRTRSLNVKYDGPSRGGPRSFELRIEMNSQDEITARVCHTINCHNHKETIEELEWHMRPRSQNPHGYPWSWREPATVEGALNIRVCLEMAHEVGRDLWGCYSFWHMMDTHDERDKMVEEYERAQHG